MSTKQKGTTMSKSNTKRQSKVLDDLTQSTSAPTNVTEPTIVSPVVQETSEAGRKNKIEMSMVEWADICDKNNLKTKSAMIRYLWSVNYTRSAIAKFLNILYQHVRNVLVQEPKRVAKVETTQAENGPATEAE